MAADGRSRCGILRFDGLVCRSVNGVPNGAYRHSDMKSAESQTGNDCCGDRLSQNGKGAFTMLQSKIISSMEKCFWDQTLSDFEALTSLRMFHNERGSLQFAAFDPDETNNFEGSHLNLAHVVLRGALAQYATIHIVENIPNMMPCPATSEETRKIDPTFLRTTPGLYPDVLAKPLRGGDGMPVINQQLHAAYIDFEGDLPVGVHPTTIALADDQYNVLTEQTIDIEVLPFDLPEQTTRVTNWFYADCLADYYNVEAFSDRHFEICGHFIETAVKNGINMILTPLFTVALDTLHEKGRTTTQLVRIARDNGVYSFDFTLLDRWIDLCDRLGVRYFEMSHLYTQWGAAHAPKIYVTVDGVEQKLFDCHTDASGEEYVTFLRTFLAELTAHLEARGLKDRCYFHISDEPGGDTLPQYRKNRETVDPVLKGWKLLDALSHVEFYREGLCEIPVPNSGAIETFMKEDIKERWVYYCCGPWAKGYSNRFIAMSLPRTRSIGMQMYKYGIEGFLHWGYNFYNSRGSFDHVNPFLMPNAGYWFAAGDAHVVYPGQDGYPLDSLRLRAMKQAFDDIRVMKLAEECCGKETVVAEMEKITGKIDFAHSVNDVATMQRLRDRMIDLVCGK